MKNRSRYLLVAIILIAFLCVGARTYYKMQNRYVTFEDENMAITICDALGEDVQPDEVRYKDLANITELDIGFLGNYETLIDIEKCYALKNLYVNGYGGVLDEQMEEGEPTKVLTEAENLQMQEELAEIVPSLKQLEVFIYANPENNANLHDMSFVAKCNNLKSLYISDSYIYDYSFLSECTDVEELFLAGDQISTADALVELEGLKKLCIYDTPLSENEEEITRLCEALSETEIYVSADRIENKDVKND